MSPSGSGAWSGGQLMMASPEGSSASDIATNRVFWISSIRTDSNSVDLVASWSEGLLATGSVIDVWGKFGSLAVDWAFLANREVLAEDGTNALITVRLPEERPSAAFFALATDADADGDGLTDFFETQVFHSNPNSADTDEDGMSDRVERELGLSPSDEPSQVVRISPSISSVKLFGHIERYETNGVPTQVFRRTFDCGRENPYRQYFLSTSSDGLGVYVGWGLRFSVVDSNGREAEIEWAGGGRLANLSPSFDSLTVTVTLGSDGFDSYNDLYLVAYDPTYALGGAIEANISSNCTAFVLLDSMETTVTFDYSARPSQNFLGADEQSTEPFAGIPGVSLVPRLMGLQGGGFTIRFGAPGEYDLPLGRKVLVLRPSVTYGIPHAYGGDTLGYWDYSYEVRHAYPLDSKCLWKHWVSGGGLDYGCSCEPAISAGLDVSAYPLIDMDVTADGETAQGTLTIDGATVWRGEATHRVSTVGGDCWELEDQCDSCSSGCENGSCDGYDGDSTGSVRFRLALGFPSANGVSGFLYFDRDEPFQVTPRSFELLKRPDANVTDTTDGRVRTVVCSDFRGRTLTVSNAVSGIGIRVTDTATGALDHDWLVSNELDGIRFRKFSKIGNLMSDRTYACSDGIWSCIDNVSGLGTVSASSYDEWSWPQFVEERETVCDGQTVGRLVTESAIIGWGDCARKREVHRSELGAGGRRKESFAEYWDEGADVPRHGLVRLTYGDDRPWCYRDYDERGRETFRLDQRDGSECPGSGGWSLSSLPDSAAFVTVSDYAPQSGDTGNPRDAEKVRCESRYVSADGAATLIGRTWRRYERGMANGFPCVTVTETKAHAPSASVGDLANAVTVETRYADDAGDVPHVLRGELVSRTGADGVTELHELTVLSNRVRTVVRRLKGGAEAKTRQVTERDLAYGNVLYEATALTASGVEFGWKRHRYDEKNRLRLTEYDDGSFETNAWSCCRRLWSRDRTGARTLRSATTGTDHLYYAEEQVGVRDLPRDERWYDEAWSESAFEDAFPVTQHFIDALGRETNVVCRSARTEGEAVDPAFPNRTGYVTTETTAYPEGVSDVVETTDARGLRTIRTRFGDEESEMSVTEELEPGASVPSVVVSNVTIRGGATLAWRRSGGKTTLRTISSTYGSDGCRTECDVTESSDCGVVTNSVARYDFLGRLTVRETPLSCVSNVYDGASSAVLFSADSVSDLVSTNLYDAVGDPIGVRANGVDELSVVGYASADGQWWRIEEECRVAGAETNAWTQMKIRLTGLSDSLRSETELWRDGERVSRAVTSFDPVTALLTEDREDAQTGVSRTKSRYGRELETEARDGRTCRYFSPLGEEFSQWRTNPSTGAMSPNVLTEVNGCGDVIERATCWKKTDVHLTEYDHDCRGNVTNETNAVGESVIRRYGPDGELLSETGDAYPVSFASDSSLRRTALSTTRDGTLHDTTGWSYDFQTGLCTNKTYADGSCVAYTHTPDGLPLRTTAPDGSWWENVYDTGRRPVARASSDPSCAASYDLDPFGRIVSVTSPSASYGYSLAANGVATNETATLGGVSAEIRRGLDRVGRLTSLSVGGSSDWTFAYADSGLLAVLSNADVRVDYAYDRNANDVGYVLTLAGGATFERRLTRHSYLRGEVTKVTNVCGAESNEIAYAYDALQRPVSRNADMFAYNRRGEVASATVAGEPSAYAYDFIGNATSVTVDGATTTYAANALNQYETVAEPDATLEPAYTPNGELAAFGPWTYAYDALSRLTEVRSNGVLVASNSYDHLGRRVRLVTQTAAHTFIYDGWNVVLELVEQGGVTDRIEYYWGKDISGSLQGAGGVGGLLYLKRNGSIFVPIYDAYGNVMEYRAADGSLAASYVYDAFGRTILQTGSLADVFRFRYSTKSFERESGLYYYGCRYYHPLLRKWLSRDPRGVAGGLNLYCFCRNIPVGLYDYLGQTSVSISMSVGEQDSFAGKLMFLDIAVTVNEPPEGDGFLTFIQLKKPEGQEWSLDNRGEIGPYYYSRINLGKWSGKDDAGHEVLHLYDAPGGATTAPSSFYVAVVEVQRSCSGTVPKIKCYDKVTLIDSRTWTYQPLSANHYSYENESRGKGMIPRLRDLIGNIKWGCEICSDLKVEISK